MWQGISINLRDLKEQAEAANVTWQEKEKNIKYAFKKKLCCYQPQ